MAFSATDKKKTGMDIIQAAIIAGVLALLSFAIWKILNGVLGVDDTNTRSLKGTPSSPSVSCGSPPSSLSCSRGMSCSSSGTWICN
jgi:hypothetical protein